MHLDVSAEFAEKYLRKGIKIAITGRIQTGSYTNRDGQKVYTTDVVVEEQEFAEEQSLEQAMSNAADLHRLRDLTPSTAARRWLYEYSGWN